MKRANHWLSAFGLVAMVAFAQGALGATTCTSGAVNADWKDLLVWSPALKCNLAGGPPAGSNVVIANGSTIKVDSNTKTVANVTVNTGGTLKGNAGNTLSLTGNFINNGTFTANNGTVAFVGTNQTIGGTSPITFANLTVGKNTVLTLTANVTVTGTVTGTITLAKTCPSDFTLTLANGTVMHSCPVVAPGDFDVFETSTPANAITGVIKTKVAGSAFSLDVVAITAGAQGKQFTDVVKVELLGNTSTGVALDAANCPASSTLIQTVTPAPTITNGRSTVSFAAVGDAWKDVRVRVSYPATGTAKVVACSTDNFAIRPAGLANFVVSDANWTTAGTARVLGNVTSDAQQGCSDAATPAGCTATTRVIHKAGQPFSVSATAVNAAPTPVTTTNYTGTPTALLTACAGTACPASVGAFSLGTTGAAVTGVVNSTDATYDEVGSFTLQLEDQTFASVDAADSTTAERYFSSAAIDVGRFVPDHFDTAVVATATTPMPCPTGLACPVSFNGFIYSGQPFSVQVVAQDAAGNTTANYDGPLGLSRGANLTAWDARGSVVTQNPGGGAVANGAVAAATFGAGVATTATPTYTFNAAITAPADIFVRAVDGDGVSSLRATNPTTTSVEGGVMVVSGRIKISNAYGSEMLPLPMTATVQYCSAVAGGNCTWAKSATDSATTFDSKLSTAGGNLVAAIVSGLGGGVSVSGPAAAAVAAGARTFSLAAPGVTGIANISRDAPAYLPSVAGRATFGVYKGSNTVIYRGRRGR